MSDLISRQAAIDAIGKVADELYENIKKGATFPQRQWFDGMAHAQSILEDLPSTQPKRKKGQWCEHYSHEDGERDGVQCSECGTHYYFGGQLMNFCPECGADMRGEDNGKQT